MTIYLDQLAAFFLILVIYTVLLVIIGYYWYNFRYLPTLEQGEPSFAEDIRQLTDNVTAGFKQALGAVKVDIDLEKITESLTSNFYATFLAILGVNLENQEEIESFNFRDYIRTIVDSSVESIVPETIKSFEAILPDFADSFIEGIQKALAGAVEGLPEGAPAPAARQQVAGSMPDLDIGKMIQMYLLQYLMKSMGAGGGSLNLGNLLGGGGAPVSPSSSGF